MKPIKFIADVNIEKPVIDFLKVNGYDVKWVPDYDCEMLDEDLLTLANAEERVLITNDKDFGEMIFLQKRLAAGVILFRLKEQKSDEKVDLIKKLLRQHQDKVMNHFVVLTKKRIRIIMLEDRI